MYSVKSVLVLMLDLSGLAPYIWAAVLMLIAEVVVLWVLLWTKLYTVHFLFLTKQTPSKENGIREKVPVEKGLSIVKSI